MPQPTFLSFLHGDAPPALLTWAVRSSVALGVEAVRLSGKDPPAETYDAASSLRIPLQIGTDADFDASVVKTPSLPSSEYLRTLLPPAECNLTGRAMESVFAGWAGPDAASPLDLFAGALRRFRVPAWFDHGVRLIEMAQAEDAARCVEEARLESSDAERTIPLLVPGKGVPVSVMDPDGGWRLSFYRLREALRPAIVATRLDASGTTLHVFASNRRHEPLRAWAHWRIVRTDGILLDEGGGAFSLEARSSAEVGTVPLSGLLRQYSPHSVIAWTTLETDSGEVLSRRPTLFCPPKHLSLLDPSIAVEVEAVPARSAKGTPEWRHDFRMLFPGHDDESETRRDGGHWFRVTLTALSPALWVVLSAPGLSGLHFGSNGFPLESESPFEVLVRSEQPLTPKAFRSALRVESLFDTYVER